MICCDVEHSLYDRSLGGEHHDFLVHIPEGGAYAPGVSYGEALSAACDATHDITSVPVFARLLQDMAHVDIVFYGMGDLQSDLAFLGETVVEMFHFAIEAVAELL